MQRKAVWYTLYSCGGGFSAPAYQDDFFPRSWLKHTTVGRVGLRVTSTHPISISLFAHHDASAPPPVVNRALVCGSMVVGLPELAACGERVSFKIDRPIHGDDTTQPSIGFEWVCDSPPGREIHLGLVICTMNRERQLQALLEQCAAQSAILASCVIVNQGQHIPVERLSQFSHVHVYEQSNHGGAGGFTRGIMETIEMPEITHIILMDDDVEIDGSLFARMRSVLAYARETFCLGGQMLDSHQDAEVLSLGHRFDPLRAVTTNHEGYAHASSTSALQSSLDVEFCGWWCFCFPRGAIDVCGLPLPLFLRGDDTEYGLRLMRAGYLTRMWPGIYVRHPRLTTQTKAWHVFYDRRNALLCSALATGAIPKKAISRILRGVINSVALFRYAEARAALLALELSLAGSESLERWTLYEHDRLVADEELVFGPPMEPTCAPKRYRSAAARTLITIIRVVGDLLSAKTATRDEPPVIDARHWLVGTLSRPAQVYITTGGEVILRNKDPQQARAIVRRSLDVLLASLTHPPLDRGALLSLGTFVWWTQRLNSQITRLF